MEKSFSIPSPKVKPRGKLPPPPSIHRDKKKEEKKRGCRGKVSGSFPEVGV